jgi:hypothetical protein
MEPLKVFFSGESKCQKEKCRNKASYSSKMMLLCGTHSRQDKGRKDLPKNPDKKNVVRTEHMLRQKVIDEHAARNRTNGIRGSVQVAKMHMRRAVTYVEGFMNVYPNFRQQNRQDGFGCKSLSPMSMGPIEHGQPGLPPAKNLENFHQGNKCFAREYDHEKDLILPEFFETQARFYNDSVPHRHKIRGEKPVFSIFRLKGGTNERVSYIESRQFYCHFYEQFARQSKDYQTLDEFLNNGYNLRIVGFDGFDASPEKCDEYYLDGSRPFGHELVLFTMLTTMNPKDYPWVRHRDARFWTGCPF